MGGATNRVEHVRQCLPEICTLDCGTMNFAEADYVMTNTPGMLRAMGGMMTAMGVKPEIEAFDTGHLWFAKQLVEEGVLKPDALVQLCMGVPWGAPDDLNTFMAMVNNVPSDWTWSAFSLGRNQMAYVAAAVLAGGNVRVGLEDNLWLDKGVLATNAQLVERPVTIVENMGARVIGPDEVRKKLNLTKRAPPASLESPCRAIPTTDRAEAERWRSCMKTVKFTAMKDGDREDYEFLTAHEIEYAAKTGDRLLDALVQLDEGLSGYKITRLGHSLQAATRAWRDGADTDWIACALLHDIGDIYAPYNHDEYAAAILKPFVREQCTWVVEKHGDFQRLYYAHHLGGNPPRARQVRRPCLFRRLRPVLRALGPVELRSGLRHAADRLLPALRARGVRAARPTIPPVIRAGDARRADRSRNSQTEKRSIRMSIIDKAAAIGGGVIGAGWVARLLLNGIDVSIYDPDPEASRKVGEVMKGARRAYKQMLPDGLPKEGKLTFAKTIAEAVEGRRLHPGKRAGAARPEAQGAGRDRPACAGQRHRRLVDLRHQAVRHADGDEEASGAAGRRPSVQPGLSAAAGRDRRRQADLPGRRSRSPRRSMPRSA